jgi:hypothetical protein
MQLQNEPPVSEAVCEVLFADGQSWDWTIPGLFYSQIKHEFPKRREQRYLKGEPVSLLFLREDERVQIQVGANALSVKHSSPYSGWEHFRATIQRALSAYIQVAQPTHIQRMSLRYVYPTHALACASTARPLPLPEVIRNAPQRWMQRATIPYADALETLTVQVETVSEPSASEQHTQLEVMLAIELEQAFQVEPCLQWLERAQAIVVAIGKAFTEPAASNITEASFVLDTTAFADSATEDPSLPPPPRIVARAHLLTASPATFNFVDDFAE